MTFDNSCNINVRPIFLYIIGFKTIEYTTKAIRYFKPVTLLIKFALFFNTVDKTLTYVFKI